MKRFAIQFLKILLLIIMTTVTVGAVLFWNLWPVPSDMVGLRMSVYWVVLTWLAFLVIWAGIFAVLETILEYRGRRHVKNLTA